MNSELHGGGLDRTLPHLAIPVAGQKPGGQTGEELAPTLKLFVLGLERDERQLLDGLVRVSVRRSPRLEVLDERGAAAADVVLIGATDVAAVAWVRQQSWIDHKAVIWIGANGPVATGHSVIRRPVQWSILPILLARALENGPDAAATSRPAPLAGPAVLPRVHAGSRPILVVDDSLAIRNHLRALLEAGGFAVSEADSVDAALKVLPQQSFDCVLMDVLMPGVDGYEGCRQIKSMLRGERSVPVVMLTSKSSPFDRIRGKMAGCDAYLTKPIDPKQLGDVLAQQLQD